MMRRRPAVVLALFLLAGCGGSTSDGLASTDSKGAEACSAMRQAFQDKNDTAKAIEGSKKAGAAAQQASTGDIKAAVVDLVGTTVADPAKLVAACRAAGVDMPDVPGGVATGLPTAAPATAGEGAFLAFAHAASYGTKDFASAPDSALLSIGQSICKALGATPSVDYPDVLRGLTTASGGPSQGEADTFARAAVANLCPQYDSHVPTS